jgi:mono/diheme cytochrome c family protein
MSGKFSEPTGEKIFQRVCAACHMPDAKGAQGAGFYPALAGNPKLAAGGYPVSVVVHGLNGMPPIGGMMTDQQVADVVNYVRTHFGNKFKDAVTVADVKAMR